MCGIWTVAKRKGFFQTTPKIKDFWSIKNRGPDISLMKEISTYNFNLWLGFHRLSIIDITSNSNQPFIKRDKNKTFIFLCNGEIFNYKYLIKKYNLEESGDCKVLLNLIIKYPRKWKFMLDYEIKGEFAFVCYEIRDNSLYKITVGRDQIGIRPLYYVKDKYIFSSEIKGISNFSKIREFPPGIVKEIYIGLDYTNTYSFKWVYKIKQIQSQEDKHLSNIVKSVKKSINMRLISDKPIGFLLSGGVDSSLVCAIATYFLGVPIHTFCIGIENAGTDFKFARSVAEKIKSYHTEVLFSIEDAISALPEIIYATETYDTTTIRASIGQFLLAKYIKNTTDIKVILVGEGPDEVCSSYLFNWNCPNETELHKTAIDYVEKIHHFDVRRVDRCLSYFGLEARVPLLDPSFIKAYWKIPQEQRIPQYKGIEKWWLRKAFEKYNILPNEVLWRKKEAFSDGISSVSNPLHIKIQDFCGNFFNEPSSLQAENKYYKHMYNNFYKNINTIPHYWQPKWHEHNNDNLIDPSARTLSVYN